MLPKYRRVGGRIDAKGDDDTFADIRLEGLSALSFTQSFSVVRQTASRWRSPLLPVCEGKFSDYQRVVWDRVVEIKLSINKIPTYNDRLCGDPNVINALWPSPWNGAYICVVLPFLQIWQRSW